MISDPSHPRLRGHGFMLKLECGHTMWRASAVSEADRAGLRFGVVPCQGGCYTPQVSMGNEA